MKIGTWILCLAALMLAPLLSPVAAQTPTSPYDGDTESLTVNITASGTRTALKLDDETCAFGFTGLVEDPAIVILTESGQIVSTTPLGNGQWSMPGDTAICKTALAVDIPSGEDFQIHIAPYYSQPITAAQAGTGTIAIDLIREEGDPFPISPIPNGGPVEGTDNVVIIGHFELSGDNFEDYMVGPLGCMGMGGYSDIQAGMQVTIKDESGTIIGVTEFLPDPIEDMPEDCKFYFAAEVPVSEFYTIDSGRRGSLTFSHQDLEEADWIVRLSIG